MDGKQYLYDLRQLLEEDSDSGYIDDFTSYRFINEAAADFVIRTGALKATQDVTTVADQAAYDLNADFMEPYYKNRDNQYIVKYNDGNSSTFLSLKESENVFIADQGSDSGTPGGFSFELKSSLDTRLSSTTTSAGAASGGECTLTDSAADFADVEAGDPVHNTTDGSMGIVLSKTSSTALVTALFDGTNNDWSSSDAYVIQPQAKFQITLDPPPQTAGHTVTVPYSQRPAPIYSDYGTFLFPIHMQSTIIKYAAWLYKYRDQMPNVGDKWYVLYDTNTMKFAKQFDRTYKKPGITVSKIARYR